jgi:NTP pyrophosphatase (non-canonical NTP hydrolase)
VGNSNLQKLVHKIRDFNSKRDWEQFHCPKNLAMALHVEVAEIAEHFQWLTAEESTNLSTAKLSEIKDEIGDTLIFLLNLSDKLGIDPLAAAADKLEKNRRKYPVKKAKGNSAKYSEYK